MYRFVGLLSASSRARLRGLVDARCDYCLLNSVLPGLRFHRCYGQIKEEQRQTSAALDEERRQFAAQHALLQQLKTLSEEHPEGFLDVGNSSGSRLRSLEELHAIRDWLLEEEDGRRAYLLRHSTALKEKVCAAM